MATGGVGLGLTIARDIAHTHGGDVYLSLQMNMEGFVFSLVLPY